MGIIKENIKYIWISLAAIIGLIIIEMPLMYFLIGVLGSNPYVFALPAILGFLIIFCIEYNFVSAEKITTKRFVVFVYIIPEIVIILSSIASLFAAENGSEIAFSFGTIAGFQAIMVAITIALRAMSYAVQKFINKIEAK